MKRKKISLRIAAFIAAFSLSGMVSPNSFITPIKAAADSEYTYGSTGQFDYQKYSDHIVISSCKSTDMTSVEIPANIDNLPVTEIGMYAFQLNTMKSLKLPDTLTVINSYAFGMCRNLTVLTIPDSVKKIGMHAFEECPALETINFPDHLVETGDYTFDNTPWLNAQRKNDPFVIVNGALIDGGTCKPCCEKKVFTAVTTFLRRIMRFQSFEQLNIQIASERCESIVLTQFGGLSFFQNFIG